MTVVSSLHVMYKKTFVNDLRLNKGCFEETIVNDFVTLLCHHYLRWAMICSVEAAARNLLPRLLPPPPPPIPKESLDRLAAELVNIAATNSIPREINMFVSHEISIHA